MANYYATTVSRGGKLKKGTARKVVELMEQYNFESSDDISVEVTRDHIEIYGNGGATAYAVTDEENEEDIMHEFLEKLAPYLAEPFIVSEVGNEKCRYVCAYAYVVMPDGKCTSISLDEMVDLRIAGKV